MYAYDNEDIVVEFGGDGAVRAIYLHGPGVDEPIAMARDVNSNGTFEENEVYFYSKDHLNSIHDLTDYQGRPIQRYSYTAYGQTKVEKTTPVGAHRLVHSPYGYTSREWEQESGDYYYRARLLDPKVARFLSEDPIGFRSLDYNLFRYVLNQPLTFIDPSGLQSRTKFDSDTQLLNKPGFLGVGGGRLNPIQGATGAHTVFKTNSQGVVTHYRTFELAGPKQCRWSKSIGFDRIGDPHFNKALQEYVPTPHVHDPQTPGGVRIPFPEEVP